VRGLELGAQRWQGEPQGGLAKQRRPIWSTEQRDGARIGKRDATALEDDDPIGRSLDQFAVAFLAFEQRPLGLPARGDVAGRTPVTEEPAGRIEDRLAAGRGEPADAIAVLVGVDEVPKRAPGRQVGEMGSPVVVARVAQSDLVAAPAQTRAHAFPGLVSIAVREPGKTQLGVHLPEPVGGGRGEVAKALFARAQRLFGALALGDLAAQIQTERVQPNQLDHDSGEIEQQETLLRLGVWSMTHRTPMFWPSWVVSGAPA
jgi:hypothetical protein